MYIEAEFYTFDHVIRGWVDTTQERLSDFLNLKTETTIIVKNAQINRLFAPEGSAPIHLTEMRMEKHSILFAYPGEADMTAKSLYRRARRQVFQIVVILPGFELLGKIYLTEPLEIRRLLLSRPEAFIPLTEATASYTLSPAMAIWKSTIIFNKNHLVLIGEPQPLEAPLS